MPQLRQQSRVRMEACPDPELLTAFVEDQVAPFIQGAVTAHLAECRECSEVCARLVSFSHASVRAESEFGPTPEWMNAEKRLGNWMDAFLRARPVQLSSESGRGLAGRGLAGKDAPRPASFWTLGWVIGVAALALVGAAILVARRGLVEPTRSPQARVTAPSAPSGQATPPVAQQPSEVKPLVEAAAKAAETSPKPDAGTRIRVALPSSSQAAPQEARSEPMQDVPPPAGAVPRNDSATQDTQTFSPPQLRPNDRIVAGAGRSSGASQGASVSRAAIVPRPPTGAPQVSTQGLSGATGAQSIRLESGTRLWVRMQTVNRRTDGSFSFRGNLFRPVEGAPALDLETEVSGSGTMNHGKVTVFTTQIVIRGVSYILKPGAAAAPAPGSGTAVEFEGGRVLEMWLGAASVYERESGSDRSTQPQK